MSQKKEQDLRAFVSDAGAAISRRSKGCIALQPTYKTIDDWTLDCTEANELVVQAHRIVDEAVSILLAYPTNGIPELLRHVADPNLASRYSWNMLGLDTQARVTNFMNYGMAQLAARRIVGTVVEQQDYTLLEGTCDRYWADFRAGMRRYQEPWDALCLLVSVALGDHSKAVERFDRDLHFDLAAHESASRDLAKLAYLLAKIGSGTADEAMRYGAKALLLVAQFNYLRWSTWDQEDARIDLVAVVLATQLYQEIVGPKAESTEAFFRALSPEVVVAKMQAEVAPRGA